MNARTIATGLLASLVLAAPGSAAEDVGVFALVQNEVRSLKPGRTEAVPAEPGATIVLGETETTGRASAAKMTFGEGAVISIGQETTFTVTREAVDAATGASASVLDVVTGKVRVFVSRFWRDRPAIEVRTPTAVVGVKGSEVGVEVLDGGATLVSVFSGEAWVGPASGPSVPMTVAAGQQIRLAAGTVGSPLVADATVLSALRAATEADPIAPRALPSQVPVEIPPELQAAMQGTTAAFAALTTAIASQGATWFDLASTVIPDLGNGRDQTGGQ